MTPFTKAEEIKVSQSKKEIQTIDPDDAALVIQKCKNLRLSFEKQNYLM